MSDNRAIIPLYLNEDLMFNLFTIVVQTIAQIQSEVVRNEIIVNVNTPLSEICPGKYIQGDFDIRLLNEVSAQRTLELITKKIYVFVKLKGLLSENNLLKNVNKVDDLNNVRENEFIEFTCELQQNPIISYVEEVIHIMKMQLAFSPLSKNKASSEEDENMKKDVLNFLKSEMEEIKSAKCLNFISKSTSNSNIKAIIPLELKHLQDGMEYILQSKVSIVGKVLKVEKGSKNKKLNLSSGTCFDYLNTDYFNEFKDRFLHNTDLIKNFDKNMLEDEGPFVTILPIAIYV